MIDVDFKSIPQWIQSRRKLSDDWAKKYKALKLKQGELAEDLSFMELEKQLETLKQSDEGQAKSFFGAYSSKQINQLQQLIRLYRKENLHVVDLGKHLVQLLVYDIPGLTKQRQTIDQQMTSTEQRIVDLKLQVERNLENYKKLCTKLGIQGENVQQEVPEMITQIPPLLDEIERFGMHNHTLLAAISYYNKVIQHMHNQKKGACNLMSFLQNGNIKKQVQTQQQLDWEIIENDKPVEIDWQKYMQPTQVTIPESQLLDQQFRNDLLIDLYELLYFYLSREQSLKEDQKNSILGAYGNMNLDIFDCPADQIASFKQAIEGLISHLVNPKLTHLLILKGSDKQQQRIIQNLEELQEQVRRSQQNIVNSQSRLEQLQSDKNKIHEELKKLELQAQELKSFTEKQLSDLFKHEIRINI